MGKHWFASKTLWVNAVAGIAAIVGAFGIVDLDAELQASLVGGTMAVVNIVLRLITTEPIAK